jgi:hypothetical protein
MRGTMLSIDFDQLIDREFPGTKMTCPVYNCDNSISGYPGIHMLPPLLVEGNDNYEAWAGRGNLTVIPMCCEYGHYWELCFGFHKGQIFTFYRNLTLLTNEEYKHIDNLSEKAEHRKES